MQASQKHRRSYRQRSTLVQRPDTMTLSPSISRTHFPYTAPYVIGRSNGVEIFNAAQGNFLSWHRYFTFAYEQALIKECGYNGTQPVRPDQNHKSTEQLLIRRAVLGLGQMGIVPRNQHERSRHQDDPQQQRNEASWWRWRLHRERTVQGHEGQPWVRSDTLLLQTPTDLMTLISSSPLAALGDTTAPKNPRSDGYGYNPRCIKRDLSNYLTQRDATTAKIAALITGSRDIATFQSTMQAGTGVHSAGHFTISGDPGSGTSPTPSYLASLQCIHHAKSVVDFYVSPGDPAFWLHHAMIDRTWYIWQTQDFDKRQQVIAGGTSMIGFNSRAQQLTDMVDLEVLNVDGKAYMIKDLVSTVAGPHCYIYE
jgi:tyrosinase